MFMWSARASESSGVIGPTSRRTRPRLSSRRVRSGGSSARSGARARTSTDGLSRPCPTGAKFAGGPTESDDVNRFGIRLTVARKITAGFVAVTVLAGIVGLLAISQINATADPTKQPFFHSAQGIETLRDTNSRQF